MAADFHSNPLEGAGAHQVADPGASQIVEDQATVLRLVSCDFLATPRTGSLEFRRPASESSAPQVGHVKNPRPVAMHALVQAFRKLTGRSSRVKTNSEFEDRCWRILNISGSSLINGIRRCCPLRCDDFAPSRCGANQARAHLRSSPARILVVPVSGRAQVGNTAYKSLAECPALTLRCRQISGISTTTSSPSPVSRQCLRYAAHCFSSMRALSLEAILTRLSARIKAHGYMGVTTGAVIPHLRHVIIGVRMFRLARMR